MKYVPGTFENVPSGLLNLLDKILFTLGAPRLLKAEIHIFGRIRFMTAPEPIQFWILQCAVL